MSRVITVLKPFTFSRPLPKPSNVEVRDGELHVRHNGQRPKLPRELRFMPDTDGHGNYIATEREVDDDIADHPWIKEHFADGCIEDPALAAERSKRAKAEADAAAPVTVTTKETKIS
jgi:hypothetical protein